MKKQLSLLMLVAALIVPWALRAQGTAISSFPWSCDFETTADNAAWSYSNNSPNGWYIGTAVNNGGTHALYVSNDNGTSNAYTATTSCVSYAYVTLDIAAPGQYSIAFDWKCNGESSYDFLRVAMAPSSQTLTTTYSNWTSTAVPTGFTPLDGGNKLNLQGTTWQNQTATFSIASAGTYRVIFVWRNDPSVANQPPAAVDNVVITELTCPQPTGLTVAATDNEAQVSWTAGGSESAWELVFNGSSYFPTDTSYLLTNLTPNTPYTVSVRAICGSDDSSFFTTHSFRTACVPIAADSLPWVYGFEDASAASSTATFNTCLGRYREGTTTAWPYTSSTHHGTGSYSLYMYSTNAIHSWITLPLFEESLDQLQLSFYAYRSTSSSYGHWAVGIMSDPSDMSTFDTIASGQVSANSTWELIEVPLNNYTGTGTYLTILCPKGTGTNYTYVDDIVVDYLPNCITPTNVAASTATTSTVDLSWVSTASDFIVEYGPLGFTQGQGTVTTSTSNSITLTGLSTGTNYGVYVTAVCGGDTSNTAYGTFTTECGVLSAGDLPYVQNFEGALIGTSTGTTFVNCMTRLNNGTSYFGYPYVGGSTYNHTTGGGQGLYWYNSITTGTYGDYQIVVLPEIDTTEYPINTLQLSFWSRPSSTSYSPVFQVGVMSDPTDPTTFQLVKVVNVRNVTTWQEFLVMFTAYNGNGNYVAIRANRPSSSWYAYLDDITLDEMPSCPPIASHSVATTASSAIVTWDYNIEYPGTPTSYTVNYGYASDNLVGSTSVTTTTNMVALTGLTPDSSYIMSIASQCDDGAGEEYTFNFSTVVLPCAEWDTTGFGGPTDTIVVGTPGTSTTTEVMPVNNSYNYSYCQHIILPSELSSVGPQVFGGIGFDYAYTQPMTHATNCQIYMGHTTRASFAVASGSSTDSMFIPYNQLTLVYQGPLNCTASGWNYFDFNQGGFAYDGVSNIVVAIVNNSGSHDGSSYVFRYQSTSGAAPMSHRVYNNTTPYGATEMDAARAGQSYYRSNMKLLTGGGECISLASCSNPAVVATQNDYGDITVMWVPGYQESSWDLDYRVSTASTWTNVLSGTSDSSYTFPTNILQPNTDYLFRVTSNCSDTTMATTVGFTTPCANISIPYTQDFESAPTGSSSSHTWIECMYRLNNGTSYYGYPYVSATSTYNHTAGGTKGLYWYNTTTTGTYGDYQVIVMPAVDIITNPVNTLQLVFWAKPSSTSYAPVFIVGVMTDPEDLTTFYPVDTVVVEHTTTDWHPYEVVFNNYSGNGRYIAIRANRPSSSWYAYVDDISIDIAPNCPRVTNVTVDNITQNSATVHWTMSTATNYEVLYCHSGANTSTGTTTPVTGVDSVDITGLGSNTPYDVYVRGICTEDTGNWSFVTTFRTDCGEIDSLPFFEDFEAQATGSTSTGSAFVPCWTRINNGTSYGGYPYVSASSTYNHTSGGAKGLYWYGSTTTGTYGDYMYIILPPIDTVALDITTLQLSFWAKVSSTSYNASFDIGIMNSVNDTAMEVLGTVNINGNTEWVEYVTPLSEHVGYGRYVAIRAMRPTSTWYTYVDDITLELLPSCPRVEDLTATNVMLDSITVAWTDTSNNTSWYVEYDTVPFEPGTGHMTAIHVTDTFCTISGLDSGTVYHIYVYPDCGTDVFYRHAAFTTLAASPASVPYFCDFEAEGVNGWDLLNGAQANYWIVGNATNNGGNKSMYITNDGTSNAYTNSTISYTYAVRTFHISDSGEYAYSFDWKCQGEGNYDFIRVFFAPASVNLEGGVLPFGSSSYNFGQTVAPSPYIDLSNRTSVPYALNGHSDWQTHFGTLNIHTPGTYKLIFAWSNDGSGGTTPPGAIDNVSLQQNTCAMVQNVTASITSDSIALNWSAGGTETQWEVYMDSTSVIVSDTFYTFTGLSASSDYTIHIRAICGSGDTSLAYSETYHTPCLAVSLPYSENFDSYTTSTTSATGVHVPCWDYIMTGTSTYQGTSYQPQVYYSSSNAHSGSYSLRLYGESYTMLPPMSAPLDSLQLTFWDYTTSASYLLEVGVMEGNTFVPVQTITTPASTHLEHTVYLATYTGNSRIIAFRNHYSTSGTYYSYHYIDNVTVDYIPSCPPVVNMTVDMATYDSIQISWTPIGNETEWQVSDNGTSWTTCYDSNYIFTGLTASTIYTFYVRPVCGAGDTGIVQSITASTACAEVALPYSENFDSYTTSTTSATGVQVNCWDFIMTGTSTYQAASYQPQIYYSSSNAHSGNYSLRLYGESYTMLPPMSAPLDSLQLTFWDYTTSASYLLEVGVMEGSTFVPIQTISTPTSTHVQQTVYFATYTGTSRIIAFRNHYSTSGTYYSYHYIDNVMVDYIPTCAPVTAINAVSSTSNSITVDWTDVTPAIEWQVRYGLPGSTTTTITANSHPVVINGLNALSSYRFEVRPICTVGDTGDWSDQVALSTAMCDGVTVANFDPSWTSGTSTYMPIGYSFYNYSYVQTIIDSARLAAIGGAEISALAFESTVATAGDKFENMTIFLANVPESDLSSGWILPNATHNFVRVLNSASLSYTTAGMHYAVFDTTFTWDGHSNVLVAVKRDNGSYTSGATFAAHTAPTQKARYVYQDSGPYSYTSPSATGTATTTVGDIYLISCGGSCAAPVVTAVNQDYQSATITVSGNNLGYDMHYGTDVGSLTNTMSSTTGVFNLTGLMPATQYFYSITQSCDSGMVSPATEGYFFTDSLPCMEVTNLDVNATTYSSVTLSWTAGSTETAWEVMIYTNVDTFLNTTYTSSITVTGLTSNVTYNANVRPMCGSNHNIEGPWLENPVTFTTDRCLPVDNVTVTNVTSNGATVSWSAPAAGSGNYRLEYGYTGFDRGQGQSATATGTTSYTITGLESEVMYDVYVANICTESLVSNWSTVVTFETTNGGGSGEGIVDVDAEGNLSIYPNPASAMVSITVSDMMAGAEVTIVDLNGRTVSSFTLDGQTATFDVSTLAKGAYFVRLTGEQATTVRKLIVK